MSPLKLRPGESDKYFFCHFLWLLHGLTLGSILGELDNCLKCFCDLSTNQPKHLFLRIGLLQIFIVRLSKKFLEKPKRCSQSSDDDLTGDIMFPQSELIIQSLFKKAHSLGWLRWSWAAQSRLLGDLSRCTWHFPHSWWMCLALLLLLYWSADLIQPLTRLLLYDLALLQLDWIEWTRIVLK